MTVKFMPFIHVRSFALILMLVGTLQASPALAEDLAANAPLTPESVVNLHAFARLYGYIRFFHPSDEARRTDWDSLAIGNIAAVESAKSPTELALAFNNAFAAVGPTVRIYVTGTTPKVASPWLKPDSSHLAITGYQYHGVPLTMQSPLYWRVLLAPLDGPQPNMPLRVALEGGVSALIPTTLFRDNDGTLPHGDLGTLPYQLARETAYKSGADRATRLADVIIAWNIFQHFYPYFDDITVDWAAELDTALKEAAVAPDDVAFRDVLRRFVATLHDGHGWVTLSSHTKYVLPLAWEIVENKLVITAAGAGVPLKRGDVVEKIDGVTAQAAIEKLEPMISAPGIPRERSLTLYFLALRDSENPAVLDVRDEQAKLRQVSVTPQLDEKAQDEIHEASVYAAVQQIKPDIWYVDLSRIEANGIDAALSNLAHAKGIIFDVRNYPTNAAFQIFSHLFSQPLRSQLYEIPVVTLPDRKNVIYDDTQGWFYPQEPYIGAKKVFLTGDWTVSAGETLGSLVKYYDLGEIIGGASGGTNGNVNSFVLPGNYSIEWTGMRVRQRDGERFFGVGIEPDISVDRTILGIRQGRDEVLEKGISYSEDAISR